VVTRTELSVKMSQSSSRKNSLSRLFSKKSSTPTPYEEPEDLLVQGDWPYLGEAAGAEGGSGARQKEDRKDRLLSKDRRSRRDQETESSDSEDEDELLPTERVHLEFARSDVRSF
jgi:hypothetical protein